MPPSTAVQARGAWRVRALVAALLALVLSSRARRAVDALVRRLLGRAALRLVSAARPVRKNFLEDGAAAWSSAATTGRDGRPAPTAAAGAFDFAGSFSEFGEVLPPWLRSGLRQSNFERLKPIQGKVLPLALAGKDVVGIAPTGSGKTLAFLVPALVHAAGQAPPSRLQDGPLALVLAPTRELVVQIGLVAESLLRPSWGQGQGQRGPRHGMQASAGAEGLSCAVLYGGTRRVEQLDQLRRQRRVHVVVATPGRLLDLVCNFSAFRLRRVSFFVLDEGDRMLDFGFEEDIARISAEIRPDRQMLFFSATWPPEVEQAACRLCSRGGLAEKVFARPEDEAGDRQADDDPADAGGSGQGGLALPPREIVQKVEVIENRFGDWDRGRGPMRKKLPLLLRHLEGALGGEVGAPPGKALIFVRTRVAAEELGEEVAHHFGLQRCGVMHGARKQEQRESTLAAFRNGHISALVSTDVLGRGVDIPGVTHVVIFDFPDDIETYVHRVGRTGRNGQPGASVAFFEPQPWLPDLPRELAEILRACEQEVPPALAKEVRGLPGGGTAGGLEGPWPVQHSGEAPPLEARGSPELADAPELCEWDAGGARVWGYSANGGVSEQGRVELRKGGILRTTWGWGEWQLVDAPVSGPKEDGGAAPSHSHNLVLSWNGIDDEVMLGASGMDFQLVSRNGRPAHTLKKQTLGRALPGVSL